MSLTTPDALADAVFGRLKDDAGFPGGLTLVDHDLLPVDQGPDGTLLVGGVYLVEDKPAGDPTDTFASATQLRIATVRVEFRAKAATTGRYHEATRVLREWALGVLMADPTLGGLAELVAFNSYVPSSLVSNIRIAAADLDFDVHYFFRPTA